VSELLADLEAVSRFGGEGSGVTRLAWTPELFAAYDYVGARLEELGLEVEVDPAGNLVGRWHVGSGPPIAVGSHLDSVVAGGRFDGTLGVLAGVHAIRLLRRRGFVPGRPLWVISFMDEEGARFGGSCFGSGAFAGRDLSGLEAETDRDGVTLREAMGRAGFDLDRVPEAKRVDELGAYLELHVEQGPVLERAGTDIGVVTGIVGGAAFRVRFTGTPGHAGTTPMELRRDAFAGAARAALALRDRALSSGEITVNVGEVSVEPGGASTIPGAAELTVDIRSLRRFAELETIVREALETVAREERLELGVERLYSIPPCELDEALVETIERAAGDEGATHMRMVSGSGHDAMELGRRVPAGMLFVPSRGGFGHSPDEHTEPERCELGARVLARGLQLVAE
jgi:hydantoinase/carbamoylase family amidase